MPIQGVGAAQAAAAYRGGSPAAAADGGGAFAGLLTRALEQGVAMSRTAEAASTQALMGQGSVTEAVLAISRAELALQTSVALRDRVVAAYQDVMRMPV
jgi:flagellar hook-basal body complex protein FliE